MRPFLSWGPDGFTANLSEHTSGSASLPPAARALLFSSDAEGCEASPLHYKQAPRLTSETHVHISSTQWRRWDQNLLMDEGSDNPADFWPPAAHFSSVCILIWANYVYLKHPAGVLTVCGVVRFRLSGREVFFFPVCDRSPVRKARNTRQIIYGEAEASTSITFTSCSRVFTHICVNDMPPTGWHTLSCISLRHVIGLMNRSCVSWHVWPSSMHSPDRWHWHTTSGGLLGNLACSPITGDEWTAEFSKKTDG